MRKGYILLAIILIGAMLLASCSKGEEQASLERGKTPVEVVQAVKGDITSTATISGKLKALHEINVVPKIPGKVKNVLARVGDSVEKGDILFTLDDSDVLAQLKQAEASLSLAEANYRQNRERIENARRDLERGEKLYQQGAISLQMLEQLRAAASDAALEVLEAQVEQARAGYEAALNQYRNTRVTSPINGTVAYIDVDVGEMASSAMPAAVIVDMSRMILQGSIGEDLVNSILPGHKVDVRIRAAGNGTFQGTVKSVSPAAHQRTGLYQVEIEIDNPEGIIKPGMFAEAELVKSISRNTIVIPREAIVTTNGDKFVYLVVQDKAVLRKVTTGIEGKENIEILSGVREGDRVIVKGQTFLRDGEPVQVVRGEGR